MSKYGLEHVIVAFVILLCIGSGAGDYSFSFLLLSSSSVFQSAFVPGLTSYYSRTSPSRTVGRNYMTTLDYQKYYNLENHLRQTVHDTFHKNGFIDASDFFCIIIWKANRAKSKIANKLFKIEPDLALCCKQLTQRLFQSNSHKDRLKLLINYYEFRLPMSSAILSIFYPDDFSVYDVRVCETLPQFSNLVYTTNFENLWIGYSNYINAVKDFHPRELSLVDKDHLLWGKSFYDQLQNDISSNFK